MHLSPSIGHDLVTGTRFMGAFTMFALSILLAFVNRGKTQLKVYNQARWLIFTGCLLLCVYNTVQFLGNFREQSITLSWAVTTMFLVAIIPPIFLGNLFLLRAGHDMKPHIWRSVIFVAFCYGLFFYGLTNDLLIDDVEPHTTVTFYIALALFAKITQMAIVLHRGLKKTRSSLTDGELQQRHVALRYTSHAMNALLVVAVFAPWAGLSSSTLLYTITKLTLLMTLSWLVCEFCLYGYNMAETIEVNDEIREAQLMEGGTPQHRHFGTRHPKNRGMGGCASLHRPQPHHRHGTEANGRVGINPQRLPQQQHRCHQFQKVAAIPAHRGSKKANDTASRTHPSSHCRGEWICQPPQFHKGFQNERGKFTHRMDNKSQKQ